MPTADRREAAPPLVPTASSEASWKQPVRYFGAGLLLAVACGLVQIFWMDLVPYSAFDRQPASLKMLQAVVGWVPLCVFVTPLWADGAKSDQATSWKQDFQAFLSQRLKRGGDPVKGYSPLSSRPSQNGATKIRGQPPR